MYVVVSCDCGCTEYQITMSVRSVMGCSCAAMFCAVMRAVCISAGCVHFAAMHAPCSAARQRHRCACIILLGGHATRAESRVESHQGVC